MEDINTFPFPKEWYQCLKFLKDDKQKSEEIMTLFDYIFDNLEEGKTGLLLTMAKSEIDQYKAKVRAGKKGGQLSKKIQKISKTQANAKQTVSKRQAKRKQNVSKTQEKTIDDTINHFDLFYETYGPAKNRNYKHKTKLVWDSLASKKELPSLEVLIAKVEEYKKSLDPKQPEEYKAGAQVWLSNKRWEDNFTPYMKPPGSYVRGQSLDDGPKYRPFVNQFKDENRVPCPENIKTQINQITNKMTLS